MFTLFDNHNRDLTDIISTNLMYGLRRSYGEHFHLEFAVGFGYYEEFNLKPYMEDDSGIYPALDFRIGYQF